MIRHSHRILILPGLGDSGDGHWQTIWEDRRSDTRRVEQRDWNIPELAAWIEALELTVRAAPEPAILVGHSLGCILAVHYARHLVTRPELRYRVAAALLVAPADVECVSEIGNLAASFAPVPLVRLPFPGIVVSSQNDPYLSQQRARHFAKVWGAARVDAGNAGHVNVASGHGVWLEGESMLDSLIARTSKHHLQAG